jgi:transcriptional regulator with XRE-family HTH domain
MTVTQVNWEEVGKRIKKARKELGLSQEDFAAQQYIERKSLSRWENGHPISIDGLLCLCQGLKCDIGYLIGEYDCKTKEATDIQKEIGLSEKSINNLSFLYHTLKINHSTIAEYEQMRKDSVAIDDALTFAMARNDYLKSQTILSFIDDIILNADVNNDKIFKSLLALAKKYNTYKLDKSMRILPLDYVNKAHNCEYPYDVDNQIEHNMFFLQKYFLDFINSILENEVKNG